MSKLNQNGSVASLVTIICLIICLIGVIVFGTWAYSGRQKYKNDTQSLINTAVTKAVNQESSQKDAQFAKEEQYPLQTYSGPEDYGSIQIKYPKTWSGYVDTSGSSDLFSAYFNPGVVPSVNSQNAAVALMVSVVNQSYSQVVQSYQQQVGITASAYALPKLPNVVGVEISGPVLQSQATGTMVILPLRSNTLEITTDGTQYLDSFNSIILPNLSFSP